MEKKRCLSVLSLPAFLEFTVCFTSDSGFNIILYNRKRSFQDLKWEISHDLQTFSLSLQYCIINKVDNLSIKWVLAADQYNLERMVYNAIKQC